MNRKKNSNHWTQEVETCLTADVCVRVCFKAKLWTGSGCGLKTVSYPAKCMNYHHLHITHITATHTVLCLIRAHSHMHARHHFLSSPTSPSFNLTQMQTSVADSLSLSPSGPRDGAAATLQKAMLENGMLFPSEVLNLSNPFSNH